MTIANRQVLIAGGQKHGDAKGQINAWFAEVEKATWRGPIDIKQRYAHVSFLSGNVVVFNIKGNRYRLAAKINYDSGIILVKWFGTHAEYDKIKF